MVVSRPAVLASYADGGLITAAPTRTGITWAWIHVDESDNEVAHGEGIVTCESLGVFSLGNNTAEFKAALECLKALPDGWSGHFYTDSNNTIGRFWKGWHCDGIPGPWVTEMHWTLLRLGEIAPILLKGHPTQAELEQGFGLRKGKNTGTVRQYPVSKHNKTCDERCSQQALRYLLASGLKHQKTPTPNLSLRNE